MQTIAIVVSLAFTAVAVVMTTRAVRQILATVRIGQPALGRTDNPGKRTVTLAIDDLVEGASARRERSVAKVISAVELTAEQQDRLGRGLSELYGRAITVRSAIDPSIRGGLVVRVGDEIIDGSVATRLAHARAALTG